MAFGNECYRVTFFERNHKGFYGHQYNFWLSDAVGDVPEYIVNWDNFVGLASEYGLELVYKRDFGEILAEEQETRDYGPLLERMGVVVNEGGSKRMAMDPPQWEAASESPRGWSRGRSHVQICIWASHSRRSGKHREETSCRPSYQLHHVPARRYRTVPLQR